MRKTTVSDWLHCVRSVLFLRYCSWDWYILPREVMWQRTCRTFNSVELRRLFYPKFPLKEIAGSLLPIVFFFGIFHALLVQGIATSIDALSVGFTIAEYDFIMALASSLIIAVVTFVISFAGLILGKKFGTKFSNKATILGGAILIAIGIEIFVSGVF